MQRQANVFIKVAMGTNSENDTQLTAEINEYPVVTILNLL